MADTEGMSDRELLEAVYNDIHDIKALFAQVVEQAGPAIEAIVPMLNSPMVKLTMKGLLR